MNISIKRKKLFEPPFLRKFKRVSTIKIKIKFSIKIFERSQTLLILRNEYFDKKKKVFKLPFLRKFKNIKIKIKFSI